MVQRSRVACDAGGTVRSGSEQRRRGFVGGAGGLIGGGVGELAR